MLRPLRRPGAAEDVLLDQQEEIEWRLGVD
jgi:hypothetical protein